jgi:hypothetical protein
MMTNEDKILFQSLLMKAIDKELDEHETKAFDIFISTYEECKKEWEEFSKLNSITGGIQMKLPEPEKWEQYWSHIYNRLERGVGWILFSIGLIILLATGGFYAIQGFLANPDIPVPEKIGLSAFFLGSAILIVSVIREKLTLRKTDKYKDLVR